MALPTGFRPRSKDERLAMARLLADAPLRVALACVDDGWAAACLRVAGRIPVWAGRGDRRRIEAVLGRLGLPGLDEGDADGRLLPGLSLAREGPVQAAPLPAVRGPLVSILICTYNRKDLVPQAIASALAQSWPREVIVVDDGSTDGTAELLAAREDIRFFRQHENGGKARALNRALAEAQGQAVLVLDDDDLLLPGALHVLGGGLFANPHLAAVYSDTIYFDGETGDVRKVFPCSRAPARMSRRVVVKQIPCTTGAALIRMSAQRRAGAYEPRLTRGEDMDMFLRLAHVGPVEGMPIPTFLARSHDGLRGTAKGQWRKTDKDSENERALAFIKPVFRRRWEQLSPIPDRTDSHAWAIGLGIRGLLPQALQELARWPAPYTPYEAWVRTQCRIPVVPPTPEETLVVVDDGDPGSVEQVLTSEVSHQALWVCLEVPREPLGSLQIHWPGEYGARERLHSWVQPVGPVHLRTSSDPLWGPPPLADLSQLPDLPAPDALVAWCALVDERPPVANRPGARRVRSPLAVAAARARQALKRGMARRALAHAGDTMAADATWCGGWVLAAEAFRMMGQAEHAAFCRDQGQRLQELARQSLSRRQAA